MTLQTNTARTYNGIRGHPLLIAIALNEIEELSNEIERAIQDSSHPVGAQAAELFRTVTEMAAHVPLTRGVVEDLRTALTELGLRGQLSEHEISDDDIERTLARDEAAVAEPSTVHARRGHRSDCLAIV